MDLNKVNIEKLPADVRKTFRQLQVLHAEKKIQNKAKNDFLSFVKCVWPDFVCLGGILMINRFISPVANLLNLSAICL